MKTFFYGDPQAQTVLLQMVDDHDLPLLEREAEYIREFTGGKSFLLAGVHTENWNDDLSPWPAPPVFGKDAFGGGAAETLSVLQREILPNFSSKNVLIGGYSLAGLFALWAPHETDGFAGVAAASPSVWFPGFADYAAARVPNTGAVYLSLGDKEERTRNPVMAQVGNAIRRVYGELQTHGFPCTLEWNAGNHFMEPDKRTAKGFAWLINQTE